MHIEKKTLRNIFIGVVASIVFYWLLHETERVKAVWGLLKDVFAPFILGSGIAFVLNVPMRAIEGLLKGIKNKTLRRTIAVLLTFIAVILVLTGVFLLLIPQVVETVQSLIPKLKLFISQVGVFVTDFLNANQDIFSNIDLQQWDLAGLMEKVMSMVGDSASTILSGTVSALGSVPDFLMDAFIAVVFAIYCLFKKEVLARQGRKLLYAFIPEKISDEVLRILRLANVTFSNFLSGQGLEVCILGCLFAISMAIFRMPYIPLVSVLVAVTAFIPVVGAWVGCILGAFFIFVSNPIQALWFVVMFIALQQIENNLIYPRVVGASIGLSGMWVLLAVAVGGEFMGVAGMFLMIPVTSVIYTLLSEITNKRLKKAPVDPEKLKDQPPELSSRFRQQIKKKKKEKKADTKTEH